MRRRLFSIKCLLPSLLAITMLLLVGCKKYDADIREIRSDILSLENSIKSMNDLVQKGSVITNVEQVGKGIKIEFSNGESYELTGVVITIAENGNWVIDDIDTGKSSKGSDGRYYIPGDDGFWYEVDGDKSQKTEEKWLIDGVLTAKWENGYVVLNNVEGVNGPITIGLVGMNNLTIIPDYVDNTNGTNPLINFSRKIIDDGEELLQATVRFQVSPTNSSEMLIEKDNLYVKFNNPFVLPQTRAIASDFNVEFISLDNGILTVSITIRSSIYQSINDDDSSVGQLMLVVPLTTGGEVVSDWGTTTSFIEPTEYILPYLRFFDGEQAIIDFETNRGHILANKDQDLGYLLFKTNSTLMPYIGYFVGQTAQVYVEESSASVLQTPEFINYMKMHSFKTDGQMEYGMMNFSTAKYKTIQVSTIINIEGYPPGIAVTKIDPTLKKLDQPLLNFDATEVEVDEFETARGYEKKSVRPSGQYKEIIYGVYKEGFEFDEADIIKYLFKGEKLIKVTQMIIPANYVIVPMGDDSFSNREQFVSLVKSMGYTIERKKDSGPYDLFALEGKHKFTIERWNLTIKGTKYPAVGLAYVPFDGADKVDVD